MFSLKKLAHKGLIMICFFGLSSQHTVGYVGTKCQNILLLLTWLVFYFGPLWRLCSWTFAGCSFCLHGNCLCLPILVLIQASFTACSRGGGRGALWGLGGIGMDKVKVKQTRPTSLPGKPKIFFSIIIKTFVMNTTVFFQKKQLIWVFESGWRKWSFK